MKTKTRFALAVALAASTAFVHVAAGAQGLRQREGDRAQRERNQRGGEEQQQQGQGQIAQLSREENAAIVPLYTAVQAQNWAEATAALPAAQAAAQSPYARYVVGQLQFQIANGTQNTVLQAQAIDAMLASGGAPADVQPTLLRAQVDNAIRANNFAVAEAGLTRLVEQNPQDLQLLISLGQVKGRLNKNAEAQQIFARALELSSANGQRPPENLLRQVLASAYQARQAQESIRLSQQLVSAYPTPTNWRDALLIYRELSGLESSVELDARRLMRAAGVLNSEADYVLLAEAASRGGLPGEVKATLDEGVSRRVIQATDESVAPLLSAANGAVAEDRASLAGQRAAATSAPEARRALGLADAYASYGQYAEAIPLYRAALGKTGADADLINIRLGAALARAGQRAEAEAAFRAVNANGPRGTLAAFWLLYLQHPPAAAAA